MHRLTGKLCPLNYQSGWRLGLVGGGDQRSWSACTVKKCGVFRRALPLTIDEVCADFSAPCGRTGWTNPPIVISYLTQLTLLWCWLMGETCCLLATRGSGCSCGLGVGVRLPLLAICLGDMLWKMRPCIVRCQIILSCTQKIPIPMYSFVGRLCHGYIQY